MMTRRGPTRRKPHRRPARVEVSRRGRGKKRRVVAKEPARGYSIVPRGDVENAVHQVLAAKRTVDSQYLLTALVLRALRAGSPKASITERRVRLVALSSDQITVEIEYRESEKRRALSKCPVCGSGLRASKNETIFGGEVTLGFRCTRCPYRTGIKHRIPTRYTFHFRRKSGTTGTDGTEPLAAPTAPAEESAGG